MSLEITQLQKSYFAPDGSRLNVVEIDSLKLDSGEQVAMIGSSGSGKTTLLHMIAGIVVPDSGKIVHGGGLGSGSGGGVDITRLHEAERDQFRGGNIGYIFQTHHLLAGFSALENVQLAMSFTGKKPDEKWARHLLEEVGLSGRLDYTPGKLSVGQQQRVAVARALVNKPGLVLADEPTGALDAKNAAQVLKLIRDLCTEVGATLLMVTHDLQIASQFGRVVTLTDINKALETV